MYVCPECGSPLVDYSALVGGVATCKACKWSGERDDLLAIPVRNDAGTPDEVIVSMRNDFRNSFAATSKELVRFLVKWGFVSAVQRNAQIQIENPKLVIRYINRLSQAALMAVFEVRQEVEKERASGS